MQQSVLKDRNFITYLCGSAFSTQGVWIQRLTLGWMVWELTHSETWVGLIAFLMFFPTVLLGPLFGVLADRIDRKHGAVIVSILIALLAMALAISVGQGWATQWLLAIFALLIGVATSAYQPLRLSLVPELVRAHNLQRAVALTSILFNTSRFTGPAVAGLIISYWGNAAAFAVTSLFYLPLIIALMAIQPANRPSQSQAAARPHLLADFAAGIQYARNSPFVSRLLLLMSAIALFGRGVLELLPAVVGVLFDEGVSALAILSSAAGMGAVCAGVMLSSLKAQQSLLVTARIGALMTGIGVLLFGNPGTFVFGVLIVGCLGFFSTMAAIGSQSLIQMTVHNAFRGRVMSLWGAISMGGTALGGLILGLLTEFVGYQLTITTAGIICACVALLAIWRLALPAAQTAVAYRQSS